MFSLSNAGQKKDASKPTFYGSEAFLFVSLRSREKPYHPLTDLSGRLTRRIAMAINLIFREKRGEINEFPSFANQGLGEI